jgi:hypothetical protein
MARDVGRAWLPEWFDDHVFFLTQAGRMEEALAYLDSIQIYVTEYGIGQNYCYWLAKGWIEFESREFETACVSFKMAYEQEKQFMHGYAWALSCLKANRPVEAAEILEQIMSGYQSDRISYPISAAQAQYYAGLAHELSRETDLATKRYREFLATWSGADADLLHQVDDARSRLARLVANN